MYEKHVDAHTLLEGSTAEVHNKPHYEPLLEKISQGNFTPWIKQDISHFSELLKDFSAYLELGYVKYGSDVKCQGAN